MDTDSYQNPAKRCSECFHANGENVKYCAECGHRLGSENNKKWAWLHENKKPILWATFAIPVLAWLILPAPYNPGYQLKKVFYTPTAICRDGIYSFSASRSGTCSNHGGVKRWTK